MTLHYERIEALKRKISKETQEYTSHKYHDNDWRYVYFLIDAVKDMISSASKEYNVPMYLEHSGVSYGNYDYSLLINKSKMYDFCIKCGDEVLFSGRVTAMAAGTVEDIWGSYDMALTI